MLGMPLLKNCFSSPIHAGPNDSAILAIMFMAGIAFASSGGQWLRGHGGWSGCGEEIPEADTKPMHLVRLTGRAEKDRIDEEACLIEGGSHPGLGGKVGLGGAAEFSRGLSHLRRDATPGHLTDL